MRARPMHPTRNRIGRRTGAVVLATLAGFACDSADPELSRRVYDVAPAKVVCTGLAVHLCLQVREVGESGWELMFDTPRFFQFEWGVASRIVVDEEEIDPPPLDASSIRRRLVLVESRDTLPADSTFALHVPGRSVHVDGSVYVIDSPSDGFTCSGAELCDGLEAALDDATGSVLLTVEVDRGADPPLRVVDWAPCGQPWPACTP